MREEVLTLVDARSQVGGALGEMESAYAFTLRSGYARTADEAGNLITWGEYANLSTEVPVVDQLIFWVTVRSENLDALRGLCACVNRAMTGLGLRRTYCSPDGFEGDTLSRYTKTFRFGRKVDKRTLRLVD